jgi:hypothetical protein
VLTPLAPAVQSLCYSPTPEQTTDIGSLLRSAELAEVDKTICDEQSMDEDDREEGEIVDSPSPTAEQECACVPVYCGDD